MKWQSSYRKIRVGFRLNFAWLIAFFVQSYWPHLKSQRPILVVQRQQ